MRSYQFREYGGPLEPAERPTPEPTGTEVLVRVRACGLCHSDLHLRQGYFEMGGDRRLDVRAVRDLPFTLGHEIVGDVAAAGPEADGASVGDPRVVFPWIGCGACGFCDADREHLCHRPRALGTHLDGGFADYVLVPHPRYLFDYGDIAPELAGTYACSGLTAYSALRKVARRLEDQLVIIGAGGVGFAGIQLAKALFDAELIVVEVDDAKLEAARRAGAAYVVDAREADAPRQLKRLTNGGCAAVVDFAGSSASATLGFRTAAKSGSLVVVGLLGGSLRIPLPLLVLKDLAVEGSDLGSLAEMAEVMALVRAGRVDPIPYATRPMGEVEASLRDLEAGRIVGRVVLTA